VPFANAIVGLPDTPSPFVTAILFVPVIVLVTPLPTPVLTMIPLVERLKRLFALPAVPV
jgi:hypothetical protein